MTRSITVRVVYMHERGFFARNKEMLREDFEALVKAIENKVQVSDATGQIIYAEEACRTI